MRDIDGRTAPAVASPPAAPPAPLAACAPVWTSAAGNAPDPITAQQDPQLDLIRGDLTLSPDAKTLRAVLTVSALDGSVPPAAIGADWSMYWTYHDTTYVAHAHLDKLGGATYADGVSDAKGANDVNTNDTGSLTTGRPGRIEIDVPLAHVGSPPVGTRLLYPLGEAALELGPQPATVDIGGTQFDALLTPCPGAVPPPAAPAPAPVKPPLPLPLSGGAPPAAPAGGGLPSPVTGQPPALPPLPPVPRTVVGTRSMSGSLLGLPWLDLEMPSLGLGGS
jgi:hypothetical protein